MVGELPQRKNKRGGVGWWMDQQGRWRPPEHWPGNEPPVDGWVRSDNGAWCSPDELVLPIERVDISQKPPGAAEPETVALSVSKTSSDTSKASSLKTVLIAGTTVVVAAATTVGLLLTQSGADALPEVATPAEPEVVFAAETEEIRIERRIEAAQDAPAAAQIELTELADSANGESDRENVFAETLWEANPTDCLDSAELVLIERSATPVEWADNLECVPAVGSWSDPYLSVEITRTIDADVTSLIPLEIVHSSGGNEWTPATRASFVNDVDHPATLAILARDSGHNPRNQAPDQWRPSNENTWCGYAIDWIAVKHRWDLSVTPGERTALTEMLQTCSDASTSGPHLTSMVIDPIPVPVIETIEAN